MSSELVERTAYMPFGARENDYRTSRWNGFREDYGFTGKEEDVEVGLTYFGKRFLSPQLGRWVTADPLAVHAPGRADFNLYAYVSGQILKNIDPIGLDEQETAPEPLSSNGTAEVVNGETKITLDEVFITSTGRVKLPEADDNGVAAPAQREYAPEIGGECPGCHGYRGIPHPEHPGLTAYGYLGGVPRKSTLDPDLPLQVAWNVAGNVAKGFLPFQLAMPEIGDSLVPRAEYQQGSQSVGTALELAGTLSAPYALGHMMPRDLTLKLPGSGPRGMVELSEGVKSAAYVRNFSGAKPVDFIFDPAQGRFAMGNAYGHEWLAKGSDTAVGGTIWRDADVLRTDQSSGHLGHLWTPKIGREFTEFMNSFGVEVSHSATFVR